MNHVLFFIFLADIRARPRLACVSGVGTQELLSRALLAWTVIEIVVALGVFPNGRVVFWKPPAFHRGKYNR
jgi:hypothetical protein